MSQGLASDREPLARLLGDPHGEPGPSIQGWGPWKPCGTDVRFSISFVLSARLALWVSRQRAVAASGCSPGSGETGGSSTPGDVGSQSLNPRGIVQSAVGGTAGGFWRGASRRVRSTP